MKCKILHESRGRLRVRLLCGRMSLNEADILEYDLRAVEGVESVKVYDRTQDAVIIYSGAGAVLVQRVRGKGTCPRAHLARAEPRV